MDENLFTNENETYSNRCPLLYATLDEDENENESKNELDKNRVSLTEEEAKKRAEEEARLAEEEVKKRIEEEVRLAYEKAKKIAEEEARNRKKSNNPEINKIDETTTFTEAEKEAEKEAYIADLRSRASTAGSNLSTMKYAFRLIELHSYEYDTFKHHGRETATPLQVKRVNYMANDPFFNFEKDIYLFDSMLSIHMLRDISLECDQLSANHRMDRIFKKAIGVKSEPRFDTFVNLDLTKAPILLDILNDEHTKESLEKFKLVADEIYDNSMKKWLAAKTKEEQDKVKWASSISSYTFDPYFGENDYNAKVLNIVCELLTKREEYLNKNIIIKNDKGDIRKVPFEDIYLYLCFSDYYNFDKRETLSKELYNYELNKLNELLEYLTSFSQEEFFKKLEDESLMDFFCEFIKDNEECLDIINKYVDGNEYIKIIEERKGSTLATFVAKKLGYSIDADFCSDMMKCTKSDKFFATLEKYNLTLSDVKMMIASADRKLKEHDKKVKKEERKAKRKSHLGFFR